jgi:biopolymer transport protein ExbD
MPIHVPGLRKRGHRRRGPTKRKVVATLQLTAMVDMFTVLVVFLLQNYATTGQVIDIPKEVKLPNAATVKELKPANVVVISKEGILFNSVSVVDYRTVHEQEDWMVNPLKDNLEKMIHDSEANEQSLGNRIRVAVTEAKQGGAAEPKVADYRKITIQADKDIDFLTIKKIMYTVTESGIFEINFAVIKRPSKPTGT